MCVGYRVARSRHTFHILRSAVEIFLVIYVQREPM
jgi:hypothetical protein